MAKKIQPASGQEPDSGAAPFLAANSAASVGAVGGANLVTPSSSPSPDAAGQNTADEDGEQQAAGHPPEVLASSSVASPMPRLYKVMLGPIKRESGLARTGDLIRLTDAEVRGIAHLLEALPLEPT